MAVDEEARDEKGTGSVQIREARCKAMKLRAVVHSNSQAFSALGSFLIRAHFDLPTEMLSFCYSSRVHIAGSLG